MMVALVATMLVSCVGPDSPEVIKPDTPSDDPTEESLFAITVEELRATTAEVSVVPQDKEMLYVMYLEDVSYLQDAEITTPEQLWEDDFYAFESNAAENDMNLKEYMLEANLLFKGDQRVKWSSLLPGIKSVLYIYGVEFNEDGSAYEAVTTIAWELIEPDRAPLKEVNFSLKTKVSGSEAELNIRPMNWNGYYLVKVVDSGHTLYIGDGEEVSDAIVDAVAQEWVMVYGSYLGYGYSPDAILGDIAFQGSTTLYLPLESNKSYTALVYAIEEYEGFMQVVSVPSFVTFATEEVHKSDMTIDIEVTNCYSRVCDIRITPSNSDEAYALLITPTEYLPKSYTDDDLLYMALTDPVGKLSTQLFKGEITAHLNDLYPEKEYIIVTFGYSGGVVTTDVYSELFTTEPEGECSIKIEDVIIGGPYKPSDLYNYDPERFKYYTKPYVSDDYFFVASIEVKTSEPTKDMFADFVAKMDYDYYGAETTLFDLLISNCPELFVTDRMYPEGPYYVCAAVYDHQGNLSPMWMSELIDWSKDDLKPADELFAKLEAEPQTQMLLITPRK